MNKTQVTDLVRSMGAIIGTYVVAKGWLPVGVWNDLLSILILAVSAGFGIKANSTPVLVQTVEDLPDVKKIFMVPNSKLLKKFDKSAKVEAAPAKFWLG